MRFLLMSFVMHLGMSISCKHLFISITSLLSLEVNFLKPVSMYTIIAWRFLIWYFFECCSARIEVYFCLRVFFFFEFFKFFIHFAYPFSFSLRLSSLPYFPPELFCFLVIRLSVCVHAFYPFLLVEFYIN